MKDSLKLCGIAVITFILGYALMYLPMSHKNSEIGVTQYDYIFELTNKSPQLKQWVQGENFFGDNNIQYREYDLIVDKYYEIERNKLIQN